MIEYFILIFLNIAVMLISVIIICKNRENNIKTKMAYLYIIIFIISVLVILQWYEDYSKVYMKVNHI